MKYLITSGTKFRINNKIKTLKVFDVDNDSSEKKNLCYKKVFF